MIRFNGRYLIIFCNKKIEEQIVYLRIEIPAVALTNIATQSAVNTNTNTNTQNMQTCVYMRYIEISKVQVHDKYDKWGELTSKQSKTAVKIFSELSIWKFQGEWDISIANSLINTYEYTSEAICDKDTLLSKCEEKQDGEMNLRKIQWNKQKKKILNSHVIIIKNYKYELMQYMTGEKRSKCWECKIPERVNKWHFQCIDGAYLNVNENNEITYNLMEENWELEKLKVDPKYERSNDI